MPSRTIANCWIVCCEAAVWSTILATARLLAGDTVDTGAVEFRRLTESNFHGVEVVD